jgi:hypothetical protein
MPAHNPVNTVSVVKKTVSGPVTKKAKGGEPPLACMVMVPMQSWHWLGVASTLTVIAGGSVST